MRNTQFVRLLWSALAVEVGFGVVCLLINRAYSSLIVIVAILGFLATLCLLLRPASVWVSQLFEQTTFPSRAETPSPPLPTGGSWNVAGLNINLGNSPELTEVINHLIPLEATQSGLVVNVSNGGIKVRGREGLQEIRIVATRHIWTREPPNQRAEFDRLQLRHWLESENIRVEAGDPDQGLVIGKGARIDLEIELPPTIRLQLTTTTGEIQCQDFHGDLTARTTFGTLQVDNYNSGRDISLNTTSGRVNLQNVAAGNIAIRAGAGLINLSGVGAEQLELESTAGSVRGRGVHCGRYLARATTGSVELYQAQIEFELELKTAAGRVVADNIQTASFKLEAASGVILYRGSAPTAASEAVSRVGSVQLVFRPGAALRLQAHSSVGSVEVGLPVSSVRFQSRTDFDGQIGIGGPEVKVSSQVGSIRVGQE